MPPSEIDTAIDQLYQLPLEEFTVARNSLAKRVPGDPGTRIKALAKPSIAAWAINELYWKSRGVYDKLVKASERRRAAHRLVLAGKSTDLRAADESHQEALREAADRALDVLARAGHPATDSSRQTIAQTLEALPIDAPPGRLTEALQPAGFALLAGLTPGAVPARPREQKRAETPASPPSKPRRDPGAAVAEEARRQAQERARALLAEAEEGLREAEREAKRLAAAHESGHKKLETLKTASEQAEEAWEAARKSMADHEREVRRLERDAQTARFSVRDAERRVRDARAKVQ